jgi:hypothetical protein
MDSLSSKVPRLFRFKGIAFFVEEVTRLCLDVWMPLLLFVLFTKAEGDLKPSQGSKKKQTLEDVLDKFLHSTHSCHPGKAVKVDILGSYDRLDVH